MKPSKVDRVEEILQHLAGEVYHRTVEGKLSKADELVTQAHKELDKVYRESKRKDWRRNDPSH